MLKTNEKKMENGKARNPPLETRDGGREGNLRLAFRPRVHRLVFLSGMEGANPPSLKTRDGGWWVSSVKSPLRRALVGEIVAKRTKRDVVTRNGTEVGMVKD